MSKQIERAAMFRGVCESENDSSSSKAITTGMPT